MSSIVLSPEEKLHEQQLEHVDPAQPDNDNESSDNKAIERKLLWKLDLLIIPLTAALYLAAFLDRGNAGNAKLQGLLGIFGSNADTKYAIVLAAFYISYTVCNVPGNVLGTIISPDKALALGALTWGIASTAQAGCNNFAGVVVCRLFIGIGESAFGAAVPLYYGLWYRRDEIAVRISWYIGGGSLSGAFGGLIAYGISFIQSPIATWRILFLIEGLPSVALAGVIMLCLPSTPQKSRAVNEQERELVIRRLQDEGVSNSHHFDRSAFRPVLLNPTTYLNGVVYAGLNLSLASISGFLPTIIQSFGYTAARAQLFTVPPYACATVMTLFISWSSDKTRQRGIFVIVSMLLSAVGFAILLGVTHNNAVRYFATFLIVTGAFSCIPLMLSWAGNTAGSHTAAAIRLGVMNGMGQICSITASFIFPSNEGPAYHRGFGLNLAFNVVAALTALGLTIHYRLANKQRDRDEAMTLPPRQSAPVGEKGGEEVREEVVSLHDRTPGFRYYV